MYILKEYGRKLDNLDLKEFEGNVDKHNKVGSVSRQWQEDLQNVNEAINALFIPIFFLFVSLLPQQCGFPLIYDLITYLYYPLVRSIEILKC